MSKNQPVVFDKKTFLADILNPYKDKYKLQQFVKDHVLDSVKQIEDMPYLETKYHVDKIMKQFLKSSLVPTFDDLINNPEKVFGFMENIFSEGSLNVKLSVHYNLYGMMIQLLGNSYHKSKYLNKIDDVGCFMMTELYTGTDVKSLGTQVIYDDSKKKFIINTGDNKNQKFWIGNALVSARYGVLFGQLIVKGENHGIHAFIVELRDENGSLMPGVTVSDCGKKGGLNALDNAAVWFENVEIPRENLLNRYADVDENGTYKSDLSPNKRFAHHIGALLFARIGVGSGGAIYSKVSLAIALRFSHQRRQFVNPKSGEKIRIIDYDLQQHRLIPILAETYAVNFFQSYVKRVYIKYVHEPIPSKAEELMKKAHLMASISKAFISWLGIRSIQESRECCGGQGYKFTNRLVLLRQEADILVTLDGLNHVLLESVAQILLGDYTELLQNKNILSRTMYLALEKVVDYLAQNLVFSYYTTDPGHIRSSKFIVKALDYRKERLKHTLAGRLYNRIVKEGKHPFLAFNECAIHAVALGHAYSEFSILKSFQKTIKKIKNTHKDNPDCKYVISVLKDLYRLYGLNCIHKDIFFLENGVVSAKKSKAIRKEISNLIRNITPHSLFLIDQFDLPEYIFEGTIGSKIQTLTDLQPKPSKL